MSLTQATALHTFTQVTFYLFVNYAKILAYNAILKFPDNGRKMLRNAPVMLEVLALFLSNLYTKRNIHNISYLLLYIGAITAVSMVFHIACLSSVKLFDKSEKQLLVYTYSMMSFTQGRRLFYS